MLISCRQLFKLWTFGSEWRNIGQIFEKPVVKIIPNVFERLFMTIQESIGVQMVGATHRIIYIRKTGDDCKLYDWIQTQKQKKKTIYYNYCMM